LAYWLALASLLTVIGNGKSIIMGEKEVNADNYQSENAEDLSMGINTDDSIPGSERLNESLSDGNTDKRDVELQEQKDKYLRLYADFENYKRRTAKEKVELIQTAGKEVIQSMLEVIDDMERAQKQMAATDEVKIVKEGVLLVFHKLKNTLQAKGLKEMESIGREFNPDMHEAITEIASPGNEGKVIDQVEKGYYLNDKIIRFAKVVVGK
jgi:molecular chaperone GrpE